MNSRTQRARSSAGCLALDACAAGFEPRPMLGWHVLRRECLAPVFLKPLFVVVNAHQNKARFLVLRRRGVCHFSYLALMIWKSRLAACKMDRYRISLTMSSAAPGVDRMYCFPQIRLGILSSSPRTEWLSDDGEPSLHLDGAGVGGRGEVETSPLANQTGSNVGRRQFISPRPADGRILKTSGIGR